MHNLLFQSCFRWGLHSRQSRHCAGELLTSPFHPCQSSLRLQTIRSGISVALSLESPPLGVTQHPALWSSDFPLPQYCKQHCAAIVWLTRKNNNITLCKTNANVLFSTNYFELLYFFVLSEIIT